MMSEQERAKFAHEAGMQAAEIVARREVLRTALLPTFHQTLRQHPDEEDRLLELWDQLTSRPTV